MVKTESPQPQPAMDGLVQGSNEKIIIRKGKKLICHRDPRWGVAIFNLLAAPHRRTFNPPMGGWGVWLANVAERDEL